MNFSVMKGRFQLSLGLDSKTSLSKFSKIRISSV